MATFILLFFTKIDTTIKIVVDWRWIYEIAF